MKFNKTPNLLAGQTALLRALMVSLVSKELGVGKCKWKGNRDSTTLYPLYLVPPKRDTLLEEDEHIFELQRVKNYIEALKEEIQEQTGYFYFSSSPYKSIWVEVCDPGFDYVFSTRELLILKERIEDHPVLSGYNIEQYKVDTFQVEKESLDFLKMSAEKLGFYPDQLTHVLEIAGCIALLESEPQIKIETTHIAEAVNYIYRI